MDFLWLHGRRPDIEAMKARNDFRGLIRALSHGDLEVQTGAAHALGELGKADIKQLVLAFRRRNKHVRLGIIEAFAEIKDPGTLDLLISALDDPNNEVRWEAALALGEFHETRAIEPLTRALRDPDKYVRYGAVLALDKIGWQPVHDLEIGFYAFGKQDWDLLSTLGEGALLPLTHGSRDRDTAVRVKAVEVLGLIGNRLAIPTLYQALKDENDLVRWNAVLAAPKCGIPLMHLPRGLSRRPRIRKNPLIAGFLNFLLPGMGYLYLGHWWGILVFQIDVTATLWLYAYKGETLTYSTVLPIYALLAIHAWYMARKMPDL
jgi:hypothetical protein